MSFLMIDNYDSFTYNLVQYFAELGLQPHAELRVIRNDEWDIEEVRAFAPTAIILSPGPGRPEDGGICLELVKTYWGKLPIFGVCLGLQAIVQAMGGTIIRAEKVMHGKVSSIEHDGKGVFDKIPSPITMTRYHSLVAESSSLPTNLQISASCGQEKEIMAVRGLVSPVVEAVQFHPESILSSHGRQILANFLSMTRA